MQEDYQDKECTGRCQDTLLSEIKTVILFNKILIGLLITVILGLIGLSMQTDFVRKKVWHTYFNRTRSLEAIHNVNIDEKTGNIVIPLKKKR